MCIIYFHKGPDIDILIAVEGFGNFPLLTSGRVVYNTWGAKRNSTLERIANISVSFQHTHQNLQFTGVTKPALYSTWFYF
jgi:hypothetical protein